MIIRDLFSESGSTEATKINKILQRYVIDISDQITAPYLVVFIIIYAIRAYHH
jgi:hypothetical protein